MGAVREYVWSHSGRSVGARPWDSLSRMVRFRRLPREYARQIRRLARLRGSRLGFVDNLDDSSVPCLPGVHRKKERADPAARDNAREVTAILMAQLRSTFPLISGSERARPRVSHL